ncbi:MAG: hypothetical protein GX061_01510 [Eubacteriaceae bacterium]|nr:hypothetical protein [Eubacteriaceae bacterium]
MKKLLVGLAIGALCFGFLSSCSDKFQKEVNIKQGDTSGVWNVDSAVIDVNGKNVTVSGRLTNVSGAPVGYIDMLVELLDSEGAIIASGETHILFEVALENNEETGYKVEIKNVKSPEEVESAVIKFDE